MAVRLLTCSLILGSVIPTLLCCSSDDSGQSTAGAMTAAPSAPTMMPTTGTTMGQGTTTSGVGQPAPGGAAGNPTNPMPNAQPSTPTPANPAPTDSATAPTPTTPPPATTPVEVPSEPPGMMMPPTEMMPEGSGAMPSMPEPMPDGMGGGENDPGAGGGGNMPMEMIPVPSGGASAAAVCPAEGVSGDPLAGMGQVMEFTAPTMGPVTYFAFIEGPVWIASQGTLYFSDNASSPQEVIWKLVPPATTPELFMENSGSNGLAIDGDDQLILADQRNKRIVRVDPNTAMVTDTLVPEGNYTPNDLVVKSDGNIYFTDPNSAGRGFYRVSPEGEITGPMTSVNAPNGIVLSPDENTLYVGDVQSRELRSYSLNLDGSVDEASGSLFATTVGNTLDGMAVDCAGNVYGGTGTGVEVFSPTGEALGVVPTGESSNATFGGEDRRTLYVTSRSVLKAVTLAIPGLPN